jgi:hypothetical protein
LQVHADMVPQIENSEFFMKLQTIECIVWVLQRQKSKHDQVWHTI